MERALLLHVGDLILLDIRWRAPKPEEGGLRGFRSYVMAIISQARSIQDGNLIDWGAVAGLPPKTAGQGRKEGRTRGEKSREEEGLNTRASCDSSQQRTRHLS